VFLAKCSLDLLEQQTLFAEAKATIDSIPSLLDRVDRLQMLADECCGSNPILCRAFLREAIKAVSKGEDSEFDSVQRKIIYVAHRINKEWADSLVSELDTDPAQSAARQAAKRHHRLLEMKQELADETIEHGDLLEQDPETIGPAAWMALGDLNAGRSIPVSMITTRPFMQSAATWPLQVSYPASSKAER